jgi:DUF4097 and DUF4098 domain-containing protein YvlB
MTAPLLLLGLTLAHTGVDTAVHLPRNGSIEIDSRNRDIVVHTGPTDLVTIRGGSADLDGRTLQIDGDDRRSRGNNTVDVTVPTWARLDVSSVGGNLTFTGAPDRLHAETVNGFIHLIGGGGTVELETVAGAVVVTDFHGTKLSIDATGGLVTVTNATGAIDAENVNSSVVLHGIHSSRVSASSVNGSVEFEGSFMEAGAYDFNSQNANVTLIVPGDVSARMKISTMNGQLVSPQIAATTGGAPDGSRASNSATRSRDKGHDHGGDGEHTFTVVYGAGAANITVDVFNGDVIVKKKP